MRKLLTIAALGGAALSLNACGTKPATKAATENFAKCMNPKLKLPDEMALQITRMTTKSGDVDLNLTYEGKPVVSYTRNPESNTLTDNGKKLLAEATPNKQVPNFELWRRKLNDAAPSCF